MHPIDASLQGLGQGSLARITSRWGGMLARVSVDRDQRPGSLFAPMHWSDQLARDARVDAVVNPDTDPVSGQPELKHTPVRVEAFSAAWHGFLLSRDRVALDDLDYCVRVRGDKHWRYELADVLSVSDWKDWARRRLGSHGEWIDFADPTTGRYRGARISDGRLDACLFVAAGYELPGRAWLGGLFGPDRLDAAARHSLLVGRPAKGQPDTGTTVCACFNVGMNTIVEAIRAGGLSSVEAIGNALQAGTNCGSCLPELARILEGESSRRVA
jgi:assimilatory nitrate reductase catalytic subunit